jgi:hypothetical protein
MAKFAKIIELENENQVLLTVDYDDDEDNYKVRIRTDLDGCVAQISLGFETEEKATNILNIYSQEKAILFREEMEKMLVN